MRNPGHSTRQIYLVLSTHGSGRILGTGDRRTDTMAEIKYDGNGCQYIRFLDTGSSETMS